jgi:aminoglycoside phosphotransferase (APT) family kinase protein
MSVSADAVQSVIDAWFPNSAVVVTRAMDGVSTPVYRVTVDGDTFWARLGEAPGERRDGEAAAHRLLSARGLPVPAVVRYEAAPVGLDRSLCLTTHVEGVPVSASQAGAWIGTVAIQAGRVLATINEVRVRGYGWAFASTAPDGLVGEHRERSGWVAEYHDAFRVVRESASFDTFTLARIAEVLEHWTACPNEESGYLAHGDFDGSHIYVDRKQDTLAGIIDFGEMRGADRFYDLGHLLLHDGEGGRPLLLPDLLAGYRDVVRLPGDIMEQIRIQAIVIGTRALAIQLGRAPSPYRSWLKHRLTVMCSDA